MAKVKLELRNRVVLRTRNDEQYFKMSVPAIGSTIRYYYFNNDDNFQGESIMCTVVSVTQELQESWNGTYQERFKVILDLMD